MVGQSMIMIILLKPKNMLSGKVQKENILMSCPNSENINQIMFIMDDVDDDIYVPNPPTGARL